MFKKCTAFMLALVLAFSAIGSDAVYARIEAEDTVVENENIASGKTGGLLQNTVELSEAEVEALLEKEETDSLEKETNLRTSAAYASSWDKYSSNYVYNQLSDSLQELWDELDEICLKYLTTTTDMESISTGRSEAYAVDQIKSGTVDLDTMKDLVLMFKYCNPQYYFLNDTTYYGTTGRGTTKTNVVAIGVYTAFASGSSRATATNRVKSQLDAWESKLSAYDTDYEIALAAHDLLNESVVYDDDISDINYDEDSKYSQSAYSAICTGSTVCAGYTLTYEMLLNAMDVDCFGITSDYHAWNKVCLDDNWYNVDCTWDDTGALYYYFARNNTYIKTDDLQGYHNAESVWSAYLPACTLDSGSSNRAAGSIPTITELAASPTITVTENGNKYAVTISCETAGADIYYTTDGSAPSSAATRSEKYTGSFSVDAETTVRAVAVADNYLDSSIASVTTEKKNYSITYILNGGTNNSANPSVYDGTKTITLKDPTRKGYTFDGWYTSTDYSTALLSVSAGTKGNITLYAKWVPNKYQIVFKGNKSTSGSMSKLTCKYGTSYKLTANKFKRKGYTFVGWNTKANGKGTAYKNKASVKNLTVKSGGKIVLYAQWKKK